MSEIDKIIAIVSEACEVDPATVNQLSNPDNTDGWDSLAHLSIITGMSEIYPSLDGDERLTESLSVQALLDLVLS